MVLWICVAVIVIALIVLGVLLVDVLGKKKRFDASLTLAKRQADPAIGVVRTLGEIEPPRVTLGKQQRTLVGQSPGPDDLA